MSRARFLRLLFASVSIGVLVFDQLSKEWITSRMTLSASVSVIPGLVHLTLVHNTGALFGLFKDIGDPYRTIMFLAVPVVAIALILFVSEALRMLCRPLKSPAQCEFNTAARDFIRVYFVAGQHAQPMLIF